MIAWIGVASAATWGLHERLVSEIRPPFSRWSATVATTSWLADWDGDQMRVTLCSMVQDPVMGAVTTWPAGYRPSYTHPVRFDGAAFAIGPVTESVGLADDDRDGNPGISVTVAHPRVGQGQVFVSQTATMSWTGTRQADGRIVGSMDYDSRQTLLGATTWWLKIPIPQRSTPGSTFELVPLADGAGCEALAR